MNILNTTGLHAVEQWILWYVGPVSIRPLFRERERKSCLNWASGDEEEEWEPSLIKARNEDRIRGAKCCVHAGCPGSASLVPGCQERRASGDLARLRRNVLVLLTLFYNPLCFPPHPWIHFFLFAQNRWAPPPAHPTGENTPCPSFLHRDYQQQLAFPCTPHSHPCPRNEGFTEAVWVPTVSPGPEEHLYLYWDQKTNR